MSELAEKADAELDDEEKVRPSLLSRSPPSIEVSHCCMLLLPYSPWHKFFIHVNGVVVRILEEEKERVDETELPRDATMR